MASLIPRLKEGHLRKGEACRVWGRGEEWPLLPTADFYPQGTHSRQLLNLQ